MESKLKTLDEWLEILTPEEQEKYHHIIEDYKMTEASLAQTREICKETMQRYNETMRELGEQVQLISKGLVKMAESTQKEMESTLDKYRDRAGDGRKYDN